MRGWVYGQCHAVVEGTRVQNAQIRQIVYNKRKGRGDAVQPEGRSSSNADSLIPPMQAAAVATPLVMA